jgi:hypothetical protein
LRRSATNQLYLPPTIRSRAKLFGRAAVAYNPIMSKKTARIDREKRTVRAMMAIYCRDHHGRTAELCGECAELLAYALERLERCPFGEGKTACVDCEIHCYKPAMREKVRGVMRYAGPRMLLRHPMLALHHLLDGRRKQPPAGS